MDYLTNAGLMVLKNFKMFDEYFFFVKLLVSEISFLLKILFLTKLLFFLTKIFLAKLFFIGITFLFLLLMKIIIARLLMYILNMVIFTDYNMVARAKQGFIAAWP